MSIQFSTKAHSVVRILLLAAVYFLTAKFGLSLAVVHPSASAVWPPTGIALAALLLFGYRLWPGIFIGAFFANVTNFGTIDTSFGVALGNTLEAVVGTYLVNRFAHGKDAFQRVDDIFYFVLFGGILATSVSATFGVTSLGLAGFLDWDSYRDVWFTWWLGDMVGALVITPFIVMWMKQTDIRSELEKKWEIAITLGCLTLSSLVIFTGLYFEEKNYPIAFLVLPFLVWITVTQSQRIVATGILIVSAVAIYGNINGDGPLVLSGFPNESLLLLQSFVGIVGITGYMLSAIVTSRNKIEKQLQAVSAKKDEFLAMLAHELRNPLAPMLNTVDTLLLRGSQDTELKEMVLGIKRQITNITVLLEDLLDISRINEGKIHLKPRLIDVNDVIHKAVESTAVAIAHRQHTLTLEVSDGPLMLTADPVRLEQIFVNLLNNASKYMKPGGQIWLTSGIEHEHVVIRVRDKGIGIAPEMLSPIFDMFNQVDHIAPYHQGGLGVGLHLVRLLVGLHGGTVAAVSAGLGKGSEFIVTLPLNNPRKDR